MTITKAQAAAAVPFAGPIAPLAAPDHPATPVNTEPKSLTVKLDAALYAALRAYCFEREKATGARVSHQAIMVQALRGLLGAPSA